MGDVMDAAATGCHLLSTFTGGAAEDEAPGTGTYHDLRAGAAAGALPSVRALHLLPASGGSTKDHLVEQEMLSYDADMLMDDDSQLFGASCWSVHKLQSLLGVL